MYGWVIDHDYINNGDIVPSRAGNAYGDLPDVIPVRFSLYDDDNIRYYSGLFYTDNPDGITEEETYDLWSWGAADAGTVSLRFTDHPEWNIS